MRPGRIRRVHHRSSLSTSFGGLPKAQPHWPCCSLINRVLLWSEISVHRKLTPEVSSDDRKLNVIMSTDLPNDVFNLQERMSNGIYTFAAIVLGLIGFFGFVLNLLVIVTIIKNANVLWTSNNVILVNMVVSISILTIKFDFSG